MIIYRDMNLEDFPFWSGGQDTYNVLRDHELKLIQQYLERVYPEGVEDTDVNDFFWFERDLVAKVCYYKDWETLFSERQGGLHEAD
jgi:hypothetical protein